MNVNFLSGELLSNFGDESLAEIIRIVEKKPIPFGTLMLNGLPDVGLVGLIAASHIISELDMDEVAYMDSDLLPPIVVLHDGLPHAPLRIFGNSQILATISETAIPANGIYAVIRHLVRWGGEKKVKLMVSIGGLPVPNRQDIAEPKVYGVATTSELINMLKEKGIETIKEGFMVGPQALILRYCMELGVPGIALLAQSFYNYPDPEAAAAVVKEISKITGLQIDVSKLLEKGEEIRLKARDVMKRTQMEMAKMRKTQEYDLPFYA